MDMCRSDDVAVNGACTVVKRQSRWLRARCALVNELRSWKINHTGSAYYASQKHELASTGPQAIAPWCGRAPRVVRGKPSGFATVEGGEYEGTKRPKGQRDAADGT